MQKLDHDSPIPLYHQLMTRLLERVATGEFLPGDKIPTEYEICEQYDVSRTTARQALKLLSDDSVIVRARRRGSTVALDWRATPATNELKIVLSDAARADHLRTSIDHDLSVVIDVVPYDEIHQHLMRAVSEGDAPDIAMIDHVWVAQFAENHMIYPLDQLNPTWITSLVSNEIHESIVSGYRYNGSLYAVPEEVNLAGIWYDTEVLDAVDAAIPDSWDELIEVAKRIKRAGLVDYPVTMPGGETARETTTYCLAAILASNGVSIMDDSVRLDTPEAVAALRLIRRFVVDGLMNPDVISHRWLDGPRLLAAGSTAITVGGSYESEHIAGGAGMSEYAIGTRYVFDAFPAGPDGHKATALGGMGHVVFRQSSDPLRAVDLIEMMMSREMLQRRAAEHWTIPPLQSLDQPSSPASPFITETIAMLPYARTRPIVSGYQPVTRQLQRMVRSIISGSMRPGAAAERTAEFIGAITDTPVTHT